MTFPTPGGIAPIGVQLTTTGSSSLPSDWQNKPTTPASEAQTVMIVQQHYGSTIAGQFKTWYDAAIKKDPSITPTQAATAYIAGAGVSSAIGNVGTFVGSDVPNAAASAAETAAANNPFAGIAGIATAIAKFGAVIYELGKAITDGKLWRSVAWLLLGIILMLAGTALWLKGSFNPLSLVKQASRGG
jgi:hypothetical protein